MEESGSLDDEWELLRTGRNSTELIVDPLTSNAARILLTGVVLLLYGVGFALVPLAGFPHWVSVALLLSGAFFCLVRIFLSDTVRWDLRNKKANRVINFAGSKWVKRTYEGDEVFKVVVEATAKGGYGLSIVTRFGHRYQVLRPVHDRSLVKKDAERLARYFNVSTKEGTPNVIPSARSGKSPMVKWKKRPNEVVKVALILLALLLPLLAHVAGPLMERLQ